MELMYEKVVTLDFPIKKADTMLKRVKGLMFRKQPIENEGLHLIPCNGIHMFFMSFPIDVVFLDKHRRVVEKIRYLEPWKVVRPVPLAHSTLELPIGTIDDFEIKIGDIIDFKKLRLINNKENFHKVMHSYIDYSPTKKRLPSR